jgi:hypothetical protein
MFGRWVDLPTAACSLGTTTEAMRKRNQGDTPVGQAAGRSGARMVVDDWAEGGREAEVEGGRILVEPLWVAGQHGGEGRRPLEAAVSFVRRLHAGVCCAELPRGAVIR